MQGLVVKNTGNDVWVRFDDNSVKMCRLKGTFRLQGIKSTNPVVVGDKVEVDDNNQISDILQRKNHIARRPTNLSRQIHIIASNIDLAFLIVTIKQPETSTVFIDRFIASAEAYGIETVLIFNKFDLLDNYDREYANKLMIGYQSIGYKCISTIAKDSVGIDSLYNLIANKTVLLSGNSGVGKSTVINALTNKNIAKTAEISSYHKKGMHTTTFSEVYCLPNKAFVIDTPGIKGFGVVDMDKSEISHYFVEIFKHSKQCRFPNCIHIHEPNCNVLKAVEQGEISPLRYNSYISMIEEVSAESKYR